MQYILDTSVVIQWFHSSGELHPQRAKHILDDLRTGKVDISIPDILPLELLNVFIKGKGLSPEEANTSLNNLFGMPIKILGVNLSVLELCSRLMKEYNMAAYDAYFLALAHIEDAVLISDDKKAHGRVKDGTVIMLEEYT